MKYLLAFVWKLARKIIRENIHSPRYGRSPGIFVTIARDLQIISKLELLTLTLDFVWVDSF